MTPHLLAAMLAQVLVAPGTYGPPPEVVPLPWAVCVTTVDARGRARFDSYWVERADAFARAARIYEDGWVTLGDDGSEDDIYRAGAIVKVTVDGTDDVSVCQPPRPRPDRCYPQPIWRVRVYYRATGPGSPPRGALFEDLVCGEAAAIARKRADYPRPRTGRVRLVTPLSVVVDSCLRAEIS